MLIKGPLEADFNLKVHFMMYKSSQHTRADGFCCDYFADSEVCTDCDNQFLFCLRPSDTQRNRILSRDDENCSFGSFKTGNISADDATFESGEDLDIGVPNPMSFNFKLEAWPVSTHVCFEIEA